MRTHQSDQKPALSRIGRVSLQCVVGILQAQKIAFRQPEELTQTQVRIGGNIACPLDDGVNPVARHADRLRQLVLADTDFIEKFLFQNFAGVRIAKLTHDRFFLILAMINDSLRFRHPRRPSPPTGNRYAIGR